jgi:hypothetical protein
VPAAMRVTRTSRWPNLKLARLAYRAADHATWQPGRKREEVRMAKKPSWALPAARRGRALREATILIRQQTGRINARAAVIDAAQPCNGSRARPRMGALGAGTPRLPIWTRAVPCEFTSSRIGTSC